MSRNPLPLCLRRPDWRAALGWSLAAILVYWPLLNLAAGSLAEAPPAAAGSGFGERTAGLLLRSLALAAGSTAIAAVLGIFAAAIFEYARMPPRLRAWLRLLPLAAVLLPPYYQVAVWRGCFGDLAAAVPGARFAFAAAILGISGAPVFLLFAASGLRAVHGDLAESARLSAASRRSLLRGVLLPMAAPSLWTGAALVFVLSLLNYEVPGLLFLQVYPVEILLEYQSTGSAAAAFRLSLPLLGMTAALAGIAGSRLSRRPVFTFGADGPGPAPIALGRAWLAPAAALVFLWLAWPVGRLLWMAGGPRIAIAAAPILRLHGTDLLRDLGISAAALALALVLAALLADRSGRPRPLRGFILWLPLAVPGPILGAAFIRFYNRPPPLGWIYDSPAILAAASAARFFPIACHALECRWKSLPPEYREMASLSTQGWAGSFRSVQLPLAAPGLFLGGAAFLVFQSLELSAATLLAPPGCQPVAVTIYSLLHYNTSLEAPAALCLFHLAGILIMIGGLFLLERSLLARKHHAPRTG